MSSNKSLSLILGSGGARGLAHIGVLRCLEQHKFTISSISGCSIGALIGGVYAAGKLDEFEQWVRAIRKIDIVNLLDFSWSSSGLVKGDKIINTLTGLVGEINIEQLPIKYTAVAADIKNEKEVWLNSGDLFSAIRASISLPLFFTPVEHKGIQLIDGGVLNPVPIAPTFSDDTDLKLAVNLAGEQQVLAQPELPAVAKKTTTNSELVNKIDRFVSALVVDSSHKANKWDAYDVANQAFDAMQSTISRQKLAAYPPDIVIDIARNTCGTLEFDRADEMIELGYQLCQQQLLQCGLVAQ